MDESLVFEVLREDKVICRVFKDNSSGKYRRQFLTEDKIERIFCPWGESSKDIEEFYRERCFPEARVNKRQLLKELGLHEYNPYQICRKTHGMFFDDVYWVRFADEEGLTYEKASEEIGLERAK